MHICPKLNINFCKHNSTRLVLHTQKFFKQHKISVELHPDNGSDHLRIKSLIDLQKNITDEGETQILYDKRHIDLVNQELIDYIKGWLEKNLLPQKK